MTIELSLQEAGYLCGLLKDHLEYFRALAGKSNCTRNNRELYELVNTLYAKLT